MERKKLEAKIIKLYLQGFSLKQVAIIFNFKSPNTIKNILVKYNIERRSVAGYKIPFNEEFFEQIDSEAKAYFLGFMMADGNVCERKDSQPCVRMELSRKDIDVLKLFEKFLGLENNIKASRKNCVVLRVHSSKLYNDLVKLGVKPNKTHNENMDSILNLPEEMIRHFIRGFFDGDGWCTNTTSHGKRKGARKSVGFVSCEYMLVQIRAYLNLKIGTPMNKIIKREGCFMLLYSAAKDVDNIKKYFYKNANIYLKRKYNEFQKIYVNTETATSK